MAFKTINNATLEIFRKDGNLFSISIDMPIWVKAVEDDFLSVTIPFLGIKTFAKNEEDAQIAIKETINLFCMGSERFGKGLETELELLDWEIESEDLQNNSVKMVFSSNSFIFDQMVETGDQFVETLELELAS